MKKMANQVVFVCKELCVLVALFDDHLEKPFSLLMLCKMLFVRLSQCLAVITFEVGLVATDVVEHVLVLSQELCRVGLQQVLQLGELGAAEEYWVLEQEIASVVERLQFGKRLKIPYPEFGHSGHSLWSGAFFKQFVELLHFAPGVDAVIVDYGCCLHIDIHEVVPCDARIFLFLLDYFFFASSPAAPSSAGTSAACLGGWSSRFLESARSFGSSTALS